MLPWNKRFLKSADHLLTPGLYKLARFLSSEHNGLPNAPRGASVGAAIPTELVRRILIIRPGGLGDAVLTFPMIDQLAEYYVKARIDILAEKRNAGIYTMHGRIHHIYRYDKHFPAFYVQLRRCFYDLVIDTEQFHHMSTLLALSLRPTYLCGFASGRREALLTHPVPYKESTYEAFSFLDMAKAVTGQRLNFKIDRPFIHIPGALKGWADTIAQHMGHRPFVSVMPSAASRDRVWPARNYAETIAWLTRHGLSVIILGGKDAVRLSTELSSGFQQGEVLNLSGQTSLPQTAATIQKASAHLSSDTGVLHLACGLGTPTVSLFGPGLHDKWAPQGNSHRVLRAKLSCSPCTRKGETPPCPHGAACMKKIGVAAVTEALGEVLKGVTV